MEPLFEELELLQSEVIECDNLYKQYINELSNEALPNNQSNEKPLINNNLELLRESEDSIGSVNNIDDVSEVIIEEKK